MKRHLVSLLLALSCACTSCGRSNSRKADTAEVHAPTLAEVGDQRITLAEFEAEMTRRSRGQPSPFATPDARRALLDEMIRTKAALARARASGFDRNPETQALVERVIATRFQEEELAKQGGPDPVVGNEQVERYYAANAHQFRIPASVRAGVVRMKVSPKADPAIRKQVRERAASVRAEAERADEPAFRQLVQQHSDDQSTRYTSGDTGWLHEGEGSPHWNEAVLDAALSLNSPGEIAPLIETADAFYIVRLSSRKSAAIRPIQEVREMIRYQLAQRLRQDRERAFVEELKRGLEIRINEELLQAIPSDSQPLSQSRPPGLPGS